MRDLSYGPYTHAQVLDRLKDSNARVMSRFELLDESRAVIGKLETVYAEDRAALVEHNIDQAVAGSLDLKLGPDDQLRGATYRRYIKPWWGIQMPDGGWVEYPFGVYVWTIPDRDLPARGIEEWNVVLPDQLDLVNTQGPDENEGFTVFAGSLITEAIKQILSAVGITDFSGVQQSPVTFDQTKTWLFLKPNTPDYQERDKIETALRGALDGLARVMYDQRLAELTAQGVTQTTDGPVTWLSILKELHESMGYWPPHFSWNGVYQAKTALDATKIVPDATETYVTDSRSIMSDPKTSTDLSKFANKVVVRSTNPDGLYAQVSASLDDWMPGHPLAQRTTHRNVPHYEDESNVNDIVTLYAKALLRLFYMANTYDQIQFQSAANPAHEPYDFIGVQVLDDAELSRARGELEFSQILSPLADWLGIRLPVATVPVYQEHLVALDLHTGDQDHGGYRTYLPLQGFG